MIAPLPEFDYYEECAIMEYSVLAREIAIVERLKEFTRLWDLGNYIEANAIMYALVTELERK